MKMVQIFDFKGFMVLALASAVALLGNSTVQASPYGLVSYEEASSVASLLNSKRDQGLKQTTIKVTSKRLPHENLESNRSNLLDFFFLNKFGFPKPAQEPGCKWLKYVAKQLHTINDDALHEQFSCDQETVVCLIPQLGKLPVLPIRTNFFEQEGGPNLRSADTTSAHIIAYLLAII